ncbi:4-hydroxy-2-oxoglutarate aldolase [Mycolicibacterium murale]|uniref:4-hydroxy-2-oxoglutarate aldolase n=1 Tax=Mycolicibacterium murale TaxID=182220 RepID=A0A7I9WIH4_9MYCO|nr:bifunctional 4-hydroxy-2-oxoglutarate aldolase/2-dehydro-3-deoxy-phosphogluconate aldolase [Mycolicibacterium murale]MCV7184054.1 bifunctional 4-hydroxy-2-oxoglutarate aldolase/2-dehydro-3-deoxy-phosphogluconate aldolase [Mycolicibacterium murale]GFG57474.1 4-hydroxy-2-oxoglutarate aldolase [Mycolicibacterium murale]
MSQPDTRMSEYPVIPLLTVRAMGDVDVIGDGLVDGGLPIVEVALRTSHSLAALRRLAARADILVGAGTVLTVEQARAALEAGARFIVTPGLDVEVVRYVQACGVPVIPGVLTPSEVQTASGLGLTQLKLFPADAVDATACLRAFAAVYPGVRFMPSGGVRLTSVANLLSLPSVFAVSGSWITATPDRGAVAGAARSALAAAESVCAR